MNLTVFGGTGPTGLLLIEKALQGGHSVTAYARTPSKIQVQHKNLRIIKGELTDSDKIEDSVKNADAVISTLGPSQYTKGLVIADGIRNILKAMKKTGTKRLIAITTPSFKDKNDKFQFGFALGGLMVRKLLPDSYNNVVLTGRYIVESDLEWTIVRIPMLSNKKATGSINVGYTGDGTINLFSLSRGDLSDFLLAQLESSKYLHKAPAVSN